MYIHTQTYVHICKYIHMYTYTDKEDITPLLFNITINSTTISVNNWITIQMIQSLHTEMNNHTIAIYHIHT